MTAITALNVRLGMDASNFSAGADLARAEVNRVASIMRQSTPPTEKFQKEVELLNKAFSDAGKQSKEYAQALDFLAQKHKQGAYAPEAVEAARKEAEGRRQLTEAMAKQAGVMTPLERQLAAIAAAEKKAADDAKFLATAIEQSTPAAEKLRRDLERLNQVYPQGKRNSEEYARAVEMLHARHGIATESTKRLKAEAESLAKAERKAADDQKFLTSVIDAATPAAQKLAADIARLNQLWPKAKRGTEEYARALEALRARHNAATDTTQINNFQSSIVSAARNVAAAYISLQGIKAGITIASDMEQAAIAFEVMTGSAQKGQKTLADLRQFAASTPITLPGAQQAAKTLLAFGVSAEQVMPALRNIGDISGGNEERFKNLALAFAQTQATGRLMGQEVLQMVNAGFNPLQEISRTTGESIVSLKKRMEEGGISAQMVADAFASATAPGGRFVGMMDRMSKTAAGAYAQLVSSIQETVAQIGQHFLPILAQLAKAMEVVVRATGNFLSGLSESQVKTAAMVAAFAATVFIVPKVVAGIMAMVTALKAVTKAQTVALAFTGPKGWATIAVGAAAAAAAVYLVDDAFEAMNENTGAAAAAASEVGGVANAASAAAAAIQNVGVSAKEAASEFKSMETSLVEQIKLLELGEQGFEMWSLHTSGLNTEQMSRILALREELKLAQQRADAEKAAEDARKAQVEEQIRLAEEHKRKQEEAAKAFHTEVASAMQAAERFYEQRQEQQNRRRDQVSAGPGVGMEAGSDQAAKFMADQINSRIGAAAVPTLPTPGEKEIAMKARELLLEQRKTNAQQALQLEQTKLLVAEFRMNKFTRIR